MSKEASISNPPILDPETWVDNYGNYLYNFALGRLRNRENAQNVVQETFLAALSARKNFSGKSTERTWLIGILKHKIIDAMRKSYREKPITDVKSDEEAIDQFFDRKTHMAKNMPSAWRLNPKEILENKEFWDTFKKCQEKLPQSARDAFTLREIEKISGKEICAILNITPSNFWVLLHRARLQLRQCLELNWFKDQENL
ncbi:RNA polymerase ECF-type sigma factor [hydrothermal vent metagenome]|uniref:RNA polymerase ECF-type sigma factor n=1 Tax=hydrothermal vent metagenome TaxID=652676 RepID=A0A3B1DL78_9ZZZZ